MGSVLLGIAVVAAGTALGVWAGWWIRGSSALPTAADAAPVEPTPPSVSRDPAAETALQLIASRLHQLTASVAADVNAHSLRVQEINEELSGAPDREAEVLAAIEQLVEANCGMRSRLAAAEQRLQSQASEIEVHVLEARTDPLTRLANRRAFDDELARCLEQASRHEQPSCLLLLDVDHFKHFNDTYGHQAGDEVLRGVARVLRTSFGEADIVCRYGGEEFAVIFPSADLATIRSAAERGRAAIGTAIFQYEGRDLRVTASAGLAQLPPHETGSDFVARVDAALYAAKQNGRDRAYWHDGATTHPLSVGPPPPALAASDLLVAAPRQAEPELPRRAERESAPPLSTLAVLRCDIERRVAEWKRSRSPLCLLLVEIDDFATLHAQQGEKAAAVAQRATIQVLWACMRDMDHIAQLSDSLFAVLLPGAKHGGSALAAERIRLAVQRCRLPLHGQTFRFHVSQGIAEVEAGDDGDALLARAETSLTAARHAGGDCCYVTTRSHGSFPAKSAELNAAGAADAPPGTR